MSFGQGKRINSRIKRKIIQEKADLINIQLKTLEEEFQKNWIEDDDKDYYEEFEKTKKDFLNTFKTTSKNGKSLNSQNYKNFYKDDDLKVKTFGNLNIGIVKETQFLSELKTTQKNLQKFYKKNFQNKENNLEEKKLDQIVKDSKYIDHIYEYFKKDPISFEGRNLSEFKANFGCDDEMRRMVNNHDFDNHLKKNDLKILAEIYLQCKHTLRGSGVGKGVDVGKNQNLKGKK